MNVGGMTSVVFTARGARDAAILLADDVGSEPIEIVIGGWWNPSNGDARSMIRRGVQGHNPAVWPTTNRYLSTTEDRPFWIRWSATSIEVGQVRIIGVTFKHTGRRWRIIAHDLRGTA
jgi:hypothetical protein